MVRGGRVAGGEEAAVQIDRFNGDFFGLLTIFLCVSLISLSSLYFLSLRLSSTDSDSLASHGRIFLKLSQCLNLYRKRQIIRCAAEISSTPPTA